MRERSGFLLAGVHLFVLVAFAVQPAFDVLSRGTELFFVTRSQASDIWVLVAAFYLGIPLLLVALEVAVGLVHRRLQGTVHRVFVAVLVAAMALPVLQRLIGDSAAGLLPAAAAVGLAGALAYSRLQLVRTFLTALSPAVLIFPGVFLFASPVSAIVRPRNLTAMVSGEGAARAPIVVVVFDEFSTTSLLDEERRIDAVRFPNFSRLAETATWFRNATTVADVTAPALFSILTGRYPGPSPLWDPTGHTRNLFTLLGGSHDLAAVELYPFCPDELCGVGADRPGAGARRTSLLKDVGIVLLHVLLPAEVRVGLPEISHPELFLAEGATPRAVPDARAQVLALRQAYHNARLLERSERFAGFLELIRPSPRPTLYYLHILLPHEPSIHLRSGKVCLSGRYRETVRWKESERGVVQAYQRHLLQVEYVDTLIGELVARLRDLGLYDSSLLVITADHGVGYRSEESRRIVGPGNRCDIMPVPLFVKAPGQTAGATSDRNVETVDILPTMADILGIQIPWEVDGRSALDPSLAERPQKTMVGPYWTNPKGFFGSDRRARFEATLPDECTDLERKLAWFGTGAERGRPFGVGPQGDLVGQKVSGLEVTEDPAARVDLAHPAVFEDVDSDAPVVPCTVSGRVRLSDASSEISFLAVAVNGTIEAVTAIVGADDGARFSTPLPEESLRAGRNRVEVFGVDAGAGGEGLVRMRGGAGTTWTIEAGQGKDRLVLVSSDGSSIPVVPGALAGSFRQESRRAPRDLPEAAPPTNIFVRYEGWSADLEHGQLPQAILIFVDGRFFDASQTGGRRPEIARRYRQRALGRSGFEFSLTLAPDETVSDHQVRVFAVSLHGVASELPQR